MIPHKIVATLFLTYRRVQQLPFGNCLTTHYTIIMSSMRWSFRDLNPGYYVSWLCALPTELQCVNNEITLVKCTNIKPKYDKHQQYFTDHHGQYDKHQRQYKMRSLGHRSFNNSKTRTMISNRNQRRRWGEELSLPMMYFTAFYCWDVVAAML